MTTPTIELKPSAHPLSDEERERILDNPGFGRHFTDHMVTIKWTEGRGWHDAQLVPYAPLSLDPANMTLHYAQTIFEGLKAYRQPDGGVATFRPEENAERFRASARRMGMPELPVETFIAACDALVTQDKAWVPGSGEESLYLRPFMFATEVGLGVRPANEYLFIIIASPAGAYFPGGVKPVSVWLSEEYVRAAPGGTGAAKTGGNYAASLVAQAQAAEQVDADTALGDLMAHSVDDWREGNADGSLTEVFACGTAAVITPVGSVKSARADWTVADGQPGEVTMKLRKALLDIQTGAAPDTHGWMHRLG
ncbi:branched-chain amino acid aminotransferase [Streptomyces sp. MCAF7]